MYGKIYKVQDKKTKQIFATKVAELLDPETELLVNFIEKTAYHFLYTDGKRISNLKRSNP